MKRTRIIFVIFVASSLIAGGVPVGSVQAVEAEPVITVSGEVDVTKIFGHEDFEEGGGVVKGRAVSSSSTESGVKVKVLDFEFQKRDSGDSLGVSAAGDPMADGVGFLSDSQNGDGSWRTGESDGIVETAAALRLLRTLEKTTSTAYVQGKDWFSLSFPESSDYIAEKVRVLTDAGDDVGFLDDFLAAQINENDLGFGFQKRYTSDPVTTAKVLEAITATGYEDPGNDAIFTLKAVLIYLLNSQLVDGGWPLRAGESSSLSATNAVLRSLLPYRTFAIGGLPGGDIALETRIQLGLDYLRSRQASDGSWGDLLATALSFDTLISYGAQPTYHEEALDFIFASQSGDGSFSGGDAYHTAQALQALAKPDMAVVSVQNVSELVPNAPLVVQIVVENVGHTNSGVMNFGAQPTDFVLIIDDEEFLLDYASQGAQDFVVFEDGALLPITIEIQGLSFGAHDIGFRVEHRDPELKKNNNELISQLTFDDPGFDGPAPPEWVGASSGDTPGRITILWHLAPDPDTAHYAIYASFASGAYDPFTPFDVVASNVVGRSYDFLPDFRDVPIYFTVASLDANFVRGDTSMETVAIGYSDAASHQGVWQGSVIDNNGGGVPDAELDLYFTDTLSTDGDGNYDFLYNPGFYWVTASRGGYTTQAREVQVIADGGVVSEDFFLDIIDDGIVPNFVEGLQAEPDDGFIYLSWDQYVDTSGDFKRFRIYRSTSQIDTIDALVPIDESITDPLVTAFTDADMVNGVDYYYAVVVEDTVWSRAISILAELEDDLIATWGSIKFLR